MMFGAMLALSQLASAAAQDGVVIVAQHPARDEQAAASVVVLDAEAVRDRRIESLNDVANAVPNVSSLADGVMGLGQFTIRGLYSPVGAPTVALYLDDVPLATRASPFVTASNIEALDLNGIDVLRGAQGVAGGASAVGGLIRLRANLPTFAVSETQSWIDGRDTAHGGFGYGAGLATSGVIVPDRIAVRVAASARFNAGFVDRISPDFRSDVDSSTIFAARATAVIRLGEMTVTPSVFVQHRDVRDLPIFEEGRGGFQQGFARAQPGRDRVITSQMTARLPLGGTELAATTTLLDRRSSQGVDYSTLFGELVLGGLEPGLQSPGGTLSIIAAHQRERTFEVRLTSATVGALSWTIGGYLHTSRLFVAQRLDDPGLPAIVRSRFGADVEDIFGSPLVEDRLSFRSEDDTHEHRFAMFGEARWQVGRRLRLAGGVRLARRSYDLSASDGGPYAGALANPVRATRMINRRALPRVALTWNAADGHDLSASATTGFRSGGGNTPVPTLPCAGDLAMLGRTEAPLAFGPDHTRTFELAYRGNRTRQWQVDAALFHTDWDNVAQQVSLPNCGFGFVDNLGRARLRDFEVEAKASPSSELQVQANMGFVDARFMRTISVGPTGAGTVSVSRGDRLPFVPRVSLSTGAKWERRLDPEATLTLSAFYRWTGPFTRSPGPEAVGYIAESFRGPAIDRLDITAGLAMPSFTVRAFVENVIDADPLVYKSYDLTPASLSRARLATLRPRTIGIQLSFTTAKRGRPDASKPSCARKRPGHLRSVPCSLRQRANLARCSVLNKYRGNSSRKETVRVYFNCPTNRL